MSIATVQVFIDDEGRVYPAQSDEPLPEAAIKALTLSRTNLREGDIVIDTYGRAWVVTPTHTEDFSFPVLMARAVDTPDYHVHCMDLQAPLIRIYRNGEPRYDTFN